ncbi:MAG: phosphoenolpyruvate--protein phosphotransferase, partial [Opitutaceae bacterium]
VGTRDLSSKLRNGDWLIVDGYEGLVIVNPTKQTLFRYGKIQQAKQTFETHLLAVNELAAETLDGVHVSLRANIEKPDEVALVRQYRAQGVGLYRTEYLFIAAEEMPTEEQQYAAYREIVAGLAPAPVTIRTLDIGGDKPLPGRPDLIGPEANPFMGFRAIRMCLENPELFKDQLRAILRASAHGRVELMYPMISGPDELTRANNLLQEARLELTQRQQAFDPHLRVGAMIEIPSAAIASDLLAGQCDFFSIGTNDLIQYLLAIDRGNSRVAPLYDPAHPAVLRVLQQIITAGHARKIKVSVCGEMAGDAKYVPLLLGLGVDELSMTPSLLPTAKYLIRALKMSDARELAQAALAQTEAKQTHALIEAFYHARMQAN